ncbi:MAG: DUF4296 domain-containing protein [Ferruginibacter sp.]
MRKLFAAFILILFFSCGKKKTVPDGILEPRKMQSVFWDYIRADAYSRDFIKKDSTKNDTTENIKLQNRIFGFYKISRDDFYKSYDYYTVHPDLMNALMDSMIAKQNRFKLQKQLNINKHKLPLPKREKIKQAS